jgi:hypothetical protein
VKAIVGGRALSQLAETSRHASWAGTSWPVRPVRSSWPPTATLTTTVEAPRTRRTTIAKPMAATVLATKNDVRPTERVRIVFQVPWWSSLAKMSPATMAVSSGSTHWAAYASTSSASENPLVVA